MPELFSLSSKRPDANGLPSALHMSQSVTTILRAGFYAGSAVAMNGFRMEGGDRLRESEGGRVSAIGYRLQFRLQFDAGFRRARSGQTDCVTA
jgi:hypothetical protein